jgi:hypothetical protein
MLSTDKIDELRHSQACWDGPGLAARFDYVAFARLVEQEAQKAERERCAKLCESLYPDANPNDCADEIRKA